MFLEVQSSDLEWVKLLRPKEVVDERGYLVETFNARTYAEAGVDCVFVQDNQSLSRKAGTIRGLYCQLPPAAQSKLVRILRGSVFDVVVDLPVGRPTYGRWCSAVLTGQEWEQVFIPCGFAHGFCTLEPDTEITYKVDNFYAPSCAAGIRWDAVISEKDSGLPFFKDFASPFCMRSL